MTDFPDIGSEFATAPSSAVGDIDFDRAVSAFPDISVDGEGDFSTPSAFTSSTISGGGAGGGGGFSFDEFDTPAPDVKVTGDDEIDKFEDQFPELDMPGPQQSMSPPSQPTFGAAPPFAPRPQPSAFTSTPIFNQPLEEDEPQVIKDWRAQQATEIATRDERSKAKRLETVATAERSIDAFYEDYARKKERSIRENKDAETQYLSEMSSGLTQGTTWERIAGLIELENSQSKTIARTGAGTTDLGRFKEVLLRLKREGTSAPGAGGY